MADHLGSANEIVYTGGTFDLFHSGHVRFLRQCSLLGPSVVVSLNTDEFVGEYKGSLPVMTFEERKEVLESCRYVSSVVKNLGGTDSRPSIELVGPSIIAIGSDWRSKDYYSQMGFTQEWLDERDIRIIYLSYTAGISTTDIRDRIARRSSRSNTD